MLLELLSLVLRQRGASIILSRWISVTCLLCCVCPPWVSWLPPGAGGAA